ncbi:MAG: Polynucleotide adenylyltransferase region [Candidatus Woesebacteria bacterium GW2011_GWB1_45_5]|uniref:Polynucleotide adenylyltransferase region n=1 Tax=Candidatus Woesebacteria bacterium GW2011_GWB1_45_5 TaxID=1618581 RepID=A0A0G1QMG1_9BACT|nr:MAG: Polynucleotide adenylyltransferase region [Candidatus Woesebacteria bacterium GW2011_GWB1_45_5]
MGNSFNSLVDSASSVLILLPSKPYFDQVAAGLSLYLSLSDKKEATISCPSPMMVGFNRLIGINKIVEEIGNKNLTIKFAGYDATNIEKVSYDIENGEFRLTVVPKTGSAAPQKDQLDLTYAGVSSDLVILIGGANDSHFPILSSDDLVGAKVAHIGMRVLSSSREVMSFAKPGASTSEIVANLIKEMGLNLDSDTATNLVMGIEEGSSNFTSNEVTPETFEVFAHLLRNGGRRLPKQKLSPMNFPPGAIPTQPFGRVRLPRQPQPVSQPLPQEIDAPDAAVILPMTGSSQRFLKVL